MLSLARARLDAPVAFARGLPDSVAFTNLSLMGVSTAGLIITARYLGLDDRGLYLTWSSWCAMLGTLGLLGTQPFVVVAASQLQTRVSVWNLKGMLAAGAICSAVCSLGVMAWLGAGPVAIVGGALLAASGPVVALHAAVQQANGHHGWRFNMARALTPALGLLGVLMALVSLRPGAEGLFVALGAGSLIGALTAVLVAREPAPKSAELRHRIGALSRRGAPLVLLGWLLFNIDTVAVSLAGGTREVGLYGVGVAARSLVLAMGTAVGLRWFATRRAPQSIKATVRPFLPATAAALAVVVLAPILIPQVLGHDFAASVPTVQLLSLGGVLASVDFLVSHVLLMRAGYALPTVLRAALALSLVFGIKQVDGRPSASAAVFCFILLVSVLGQAAIVLNLAKTLEGNTWSAVSGNGRGSHEAKPPIRTT